ncbi:MAG: hypothetical protein WD397_09320 [Wenzhouxiangellaceae bacterium]
MKNPNRPAPPEHSANLADTLSNEAQRIPAAENAGLVARVMQDVRATPNRARVHVTERNAGWQPWLLAGATATVALTITTIVTLAVTSTIEDSSPSNLPRQASLPRIVEARVDPVLASPEQDLAGELQRIRADLDSIGRMVSIRLESDSQ